MEQIRGGYYLKARRIQDSEIAHSAPVIREVWDWLIKEANSQDSERLGIKRGQLIRQIKDIQDGLHWFVGFRKEMYTKGQCETALNFLRSRSMISTTKTTRGMIITVCKYDSYQNPKNYEQNSKALANSTRTEQEDVTINKNDNNYNKEEYIEPKGSSVGQPTGTEESEKRKEYKVLEKNKTSIYKFIQQHSPDFIEPYVDLWNVFAEEKKMSKVVSISKSRKRKFYVRLKEPGFKFSEILRKAGQSTYILTGNWFGFDWIIENDKNYLKVIEGNYDNGKEVKETPKAINTHKDEYQRAIERQRQKQD